MTCCLCFHRHFCTSHFLILFGNFFHHPRSLSTVPHSGQSETRKTEFSAVTWIFMKKEGRGSIALPSLISSYVFTVKSASIWQEKAGGDSGTLYRVHPCNLTKIQSQNREKLSLNWRSVMHVYSKMFSARTVLCEKWCVGLFRSRRLQNLTISRGYFSPGLKISEGPASDDPSGNQSLAFRKKFINVDLTGKRQILTSFRFSSDCCCNTCLLLKQTKQPKKRKIFFRETWHENWHAQDGIDLWAYLTLFFKFQFCVI